MKGLSIIVCFYNAAPRLEDTLEHLARQIIPDDLAWEIVLVNNNSTDRSQEAAARFLDLKIAISSVFEPTAGLAFAKQQGIQQSRYDYILFCDDDNWLDPDYAANAFRIMEENDSIGVLGGQGFLPGTLNIPTWFDPVKAAYAVGEQAPAAGDITESKGYVWGAGMVIRRQAWEKVLENGFRNFLLTGRKSATISLAGEDTEMCVLIQNAGYKIYYSPLLKFIHAIPQHRLTWSYYKDLCKGFARAQVLVENYVHYLNNDPYHFNQYQRKAFLEDLRFFFHGGLSFNFYIALYLEFIKKKKGYSYGFIKRKYFDRLIGRILFAGMMRKTKPQLAAIKKMHKVFIH